MSVQGVDKDRVVLAVLWIQRSGFEYYNCEQNLSVGVNLNVLLAILKNAKHDDRVGLRVSKYDNSLTVILSGNGMYSQFTLGLMNNMMEHFIIPVFVLLLIYIICVCVLLYHMFMLKDRVQECVAKISSEEFATSLDTLENFGSRVTIASQERQLIFRTMGNDGMGYVAFNSVFSSNSSVDASHCFDAK